MANRFGKLNLWVVLILIFVLGLIGYSFWNREGFAAKKMVDKKVSKIGDNAKTATAYVAPAPKATTETTTTQ